MTRHRSARDGKRLVQSAGGLASPLERRTSSMFTLAGVLLIASLLVPVGLKPLTDWAWVAGLVLVGLGVVTVAAGLLGLYSRVDDQTPKWATLGALGGVLAGGAALGLIVLSAVALVGEGLFGLSLGKPMGVFAVLTLSMAGGFAVGFLSFGIAGVTSDALSRTPSLLLVLGGTLLLVPVAGELLRRGLGFGPPPWIFLPVLVFVALDAVALGVVTKNPMS